MQEAVTEAFTTAPLVLSSDNLVMFGELRNENDDVTDMGQQKPGPVIVSDATQ